MVIPSPPQLIADYDETAFWAGTFPLQDPVHSWKTGPGEVLTEENKQTNTPTGTLFHPSLEHYSPREEASSNVGEIFDLNTYQD